MVDRSALDRMNAGIAALKRDYPLSSDVPDYAQSGYDPSKIESVRAADTGNVQSVRDWLHQFSQMTPESPDTVKARLLAKTTRAMDPALVNADIRTPEQNTAIFQRIYGDQPAPASTAVDTAKNIIQARAMPPASTQVPSAATEVNTAPSASVFQNPYALAGYEASDQNVSAPIPGGAPPSVSNSAAPAPAQASTPSAARSDPVHPRRPAEFSRPATEEGNQSLLSSIISKLTPQDPYAGKSAKQMYEQAQDMQRSGDESGANVLIQRAGQMPDAGMKRGGTAGAGGQKAAGPHKDAALHKALDIIHTMLQRGR